jgi:hypothetical protein
MKHDRRPKVDVGQPTTILTQLGVQSCLPKLGRNETCPRSMAARNGYTKRHGNRTSNPLPTDK